MSDLRQGDLSPPLGYPGGPCHVIRRIREEVGHPKTQEELVEDVERGMKLDNQQASKVYDIEMEKGAGTLSKVELTAHAQYRMDQRGITANEVRLALAGWSKAWMQGRSLIGQPVRKQKQVALQAKATTWQRGMDRREPLEWTDPRFGLTIIFITNGKVARLVTAYWKGQSDPRPQDEESCKLAAYKMPPKSVQLHVSPKSKKNLPTDQDREREQVLPYGAATPGGVSDDASKKDDKRNVPKFELNRPDNDLPERPRSLPTPGEDYGNPTKFDYNMPTRRHEMAAAAEKERAISKVMAAYKRRWKPGKRQRRQRGKAKVKRRQYYQRNRGRIKMRAKQRYKRNRGNSQFKMVQRHRRKYPSQHRRRRGSAERVADQYMQAPPSPSVVAAMYLAWETPTPFPKERQHTQRGKERAKSKKDYRQSPPSAKILEMKKRYRWCQTNDKCMERRRNQSKKEKRFERSNSPKPREASVLTSPQIEFVIGKEIVSGTVHNISPMTAMVTFAVNEKDWEHLHSLPLMVFIESVTFLSQDDIDAFFTLVDVEVGIDAYQEIDAATVRGCARIFDVEPDEGFGDQCEALTGQRELGEMTTEQLGIVNDVLVTGLLEGGVVRKIRDEFADREEQQEGEGDLYDYHLIYGIVPNPYEDMAAVVAAQYLDSGTIIQYDQEGPKQEIDHPAPNSNYGPTSPSHWRSRHDDRGGLPAGNTDFGSHKDNAPPASSKVVPPGNGTFWSGDETYVKAAATMNEIIQRTSADVMARAKGVSINPHRFNPKQGIWTFKATGSQGTYHIRIKAIRKGNVKAVKKAQLQISCSCNFFRWQGPEHWAKANKYLYGRPVGNASRPDIKDPGSNHWACKHVLAAFNLARRYHLSSDDPLREMLRTADLVPDWAWADKWGDTVTAVADAYLAVGSQ